MKRLRLLLISSCLLAFSTSLFADLSSLNKLKNPDLEKLDKLITKMEIQGLRSLVSLGGKYRTLNELQDQHKISKLIQQERVFETNLVKYTIPVLIPERSEHSEIGNALSDVRDRGEREDFQTIDKLNTKLTKEPTIKIYLNTLSLDEFDYVPMEGTIATFVDTKNKEFLMMMVVIEHD